MHVEMNTPWTSLLQGYDKGRKCDEFQCSKPINTTTISADRCKQLDTELHSQFEQHLTAYNQSKKAPHGDQRIKCITLVMRDIINQMLLVSAQASGDKHTFLECCEPPPPSLYLVSPLCLSYSDRLHCSCNGVPLLPLFGLWPSISPHLNVSALIFLCIWPTSIFPRAHCESVLHIPDTLDDFIDRPNKFR